MAATYAARLGAKVTVVERDIIGGAHDDYIRAWAEGVRDLGYPLAIRFAHEMNGDWYPWSEQANGNRRGGVC